MPAEGVETGRARPAGVRCGEAQWSRHSPDHEPAAPGGESRSGTKICRPRGHPSSSLGHPKLAAPLLCRGGRTPTAGEVDRVRHYAVPLFVAALIFVGFAGLTGPAGAQSGPPGAAAPSPSPAATTKPPSKF